MNTGNVKLEKAIALLNQRGLNGLIIYSGGTSMILRPSYLHYFSGFKPMGARNAVILSKSGEVALLVEPEWDAMRASKKSWIKDIKGSSDFLKELKATLHRFKIKGPVGLVGSREMKEEVYMAIKKEVTIQLADDIIQEIAREKTEKEIEIVRKAGKIGDVGFEAFLEHARVGIREYELVAEVEFAMRYAGADEVFILLSSGKHNYAMHGATDRRLREGDIVIGEIAPVCEGQFLQVCRTVVLGKADPLLIEKYKMLVYALEESMKTIKSGAPASMMSIVMNRIISDAGYGEYCRPPHMRARGHGFGAGSVAPGTAIDDHIKVNLERHQVIVVHPNQYIPETGYLACGETILVTDTGLERLANTETKLYAKEG